MRPDLLKILPLWQNLSIWPFWSFFSIWQQTLESALTKNYAIVKILIDLDGQILEKKSCL